MGKAPQFYPPHDWRQRYINLLFPYNPKEMNQNEAERIKREYLFSNHNYLYKYTTPEWNIEKVIDQLSGLIIFNKPANFNDPFEFHGISLEQDVLDEVLKEICKIMTRRGMEIRQRKELIEHCQNVFPRVCGDIASLFDDLQVDCFTTKNDNLLMWSHYACKHEGICIESLLSNIALK